MVSEFLQVTNRASTLNTTIINDSDDPVTFSVTTGEGSKFPDTALGHFNITIDDEILHCTSRSTDSFTCIRAQEGTVKAAHGIASQVVLNLTAKSISDLTTAVNALENSGASFGITINSESADISVGVKGYITIPYACEITGWYITGYPSGYIVIDVWKAAGALPTVANTIVGSELPRLDGAAVNSDTNLTTWTNKNISAGDVIAFNVNSGNQCRKVSLVIKVKK